jgi:CO/xanthine dehydrogenase FAD-binding subunit
MFAGGTDVMPQMRSGVRPVRPTLVNINHLADLRGISESNGVVHIGGRTSITDILNSEFLKQAAAVVVQAADCFASGQVRNAATIGGNICNASPAGDMIIPLLLLDAEVELASWRNSRVVRRRMPLCEFFTGPGKTRIGGDEVLTAVEFPVPKPHTVGRFCKFGTRPALDIAVVSVGVAGVKENGCLKAARVAFGAVAPTPIRGRKTEAALENTELDDSRIADIARVAEQEVSPITDVRASAWYRTQLIRELTERLLHEVHRARD